MRDIAVTLAVLATIPFIFRAPWYGVLAWTWLSFMNPHRQAWGFAQEMPFAEIIAIATLISLFISQERKRIPWTAESRLLLVFVLWMFVTTWFAMHPDLAWVKWNQVWKVQLFVFLTMMLINDKRKLQILIWVIVVSLGFYGVKGGLFTIRTGGVYMVLGPEKSFIGTRGEIATALNMTIPLMRYLQLTTKNMWVRYGLIAAMVLTAVAVFGTHSRGGFLGLAATLLFLIMKTRRKVLLTALLALTVYGTVSFMPQEWLDRMYTIQEYEQDVSAWGRISTWQDIVAFANNNPIVGGGFELTAGHRAAHSVYFQVLGDHGYVGLSLFLLLGLVTWFGAWRIRRRAKKHPEMRWLGDLAAMIQVSLVAYAVGGAFISQAYFDFIYTLLAVIVIGKTLLIEQEAAEAAKVPGAGAPSGAAGQPPFQTGKNAPRMPDPYRR